MFGLLSGSKAPAETEKKEASEEAPADAPTGADISVVREIADQVAKIGADLPPMLETYSSPTFDRFIRETIKAECEKNAAIFPNGAEITALSPTFRKLVSAEPTDHVEVLSMFKAYQDGAAASKEADVQAKKQQGDLVGSGPTVQTRRVDDNDLSPEDILSMPKAEYDKKRQRILKQ